MIDVTIMVLQSENHNDAAELETVKLPGVPRVGDTVMVNGALFEVRAVAWAEVLVSLTCYSTTYGYKFRVSDR